MPGDKTQLLTINGGSSSIKFTLYKVSEPPVPILSGKLTGIGLLEGSLCVHDQLGQQKANFSVTTTDYQQAVHFLLDWFSQNIQTDALLAVGHRIVHGGHQYKETQWVTPSLRDALSAFISIDPQHLPGEIELIDGFTRSYRTLKQIVCFDTKFHQHLPHVARLLPIPRQYYQQGIYRYGFHGLSYQYLMQALQQKGVDTQSNKMILAHLGNGASMTAIADGKPIDTTMAMTPAAGLVMGSRSGDLDPGLFGLLQRQFDMTEQQFEKMINQQSGLLGVSGLSNDMQQLITQREDNPNAADAISLFCYQAKKQIGAYSAALGGLDELVFSGGIGENIAAIRTQICEQLDFLGIELDEELNHQSDTIISTRQSRVRVWVIATDEELMIAQSMCELLNLNN